MALFAKSPSKRLDEAVASTAKLTERLRDAEIAVTDLRQEAERLALLGADDAQLDVAEGRMRAMVDRVATLQLALTQSKATVANLEREIAEQADKKQRQETSVEIEQLARSVSSSCARLVADAATLADHALRAQAAVPEAGGIAHFCSIIGTQIPEASTLIARLLRQHGESVLAGSAAAILKPPAEAFVEAPPPKPEAVTTVFA